MVIIIPEKLDEELIIGILILKMFPDSSELFTIILYVRIMIIFI